MIIDRKQCGMCGEVKLLKKFSKRASSKDGVRYLLKSRVDD